MGNSILVCIIVILSYIDISSDTDEKNNYQVVSIFSDVCVNEDILILHNHLNKYEYCTLIATKNNGDSNNIFFNTKLREGMIIRLNLLRKDSVKTTIQETRAGYTIRSIYFIATLVSYYEFIKREAFLNNDTVDYNKFDKYDKWINVIKYNCTEGQAYFTNHVFFTNDIQNLNINDNNILVYNDSNYLNTSKMDKSYFRHIYSRICE